MLKLIAPSQGHIWGGAFGHAPPLGHQDSIIRIEKYAKLWHGSPFVTWAEGLSFFFGLHLIWGRKTNLVLG